MKEVKKLLLGPRVIHSIEIRYAKSSDKVVDIVIERLKRSRTVREVTIEDPRLSELKQNQLIALYHKNNFLDSLMVNWMSYLKSNPDNW
jgi:hypothetical protein